jgi:hypothetical protein
MNSLNKRIEYLGLADMDYLSARLLLMSGLATTGFPKAAEAIEKIFKLFLILEAKISRNVELTEGDMRSYGHNLIKLLNEVKTKLPNTTFVSNWDDYLKILQDSYTRRYPENWKEFRLTVNLDQLDKVYSYLRNNVILNFPQEEQTRTRQFGTFIYDAYRGDLSKRIQKTGALSPAEILKWKNHSFDDFDIDFESL